MCAHHQPAVLTPRQVSSLISDTYAVPWPPFYTSLLDSFSAINVDISMIRKPLNDFFSLVGGTFANASCNFNDLNAETMCVVRARLRAAALRP